MCQPGPVLSAGDTIARKIYMLFAFVELTVLWQRHGEETNKIIIN